METALTTAAERPVFVATDDRRARRLRYLAAFAVALAGAWVVALVIGMLGIGRMPGLSLPVVARGADKAPAVEARESAEAPAPVAPAGVKRNAAVLATSRSAAPRNARPAQIAPAANRAKKASPAKATPPARTAPAATAPAVAPTTTARHGWARRGLTMPPGRTRQTDPRTKATQSSAHAQHQAATDTTTAPAATPVPPGQQKKADDATPN